MGNAVRVVVNQELETSGKEYDHNGFLINFNIPIARAGIYRYKGHEIGLLGSNAMKDIVVYRPLETYSPEVLETFANLPVTLEHPRDGVTPDNYQDSVVGTTGDKAFMVNDDVYVEKIIISDKQGIDAVENQGKKQLSIGFNARYDFSKPGELPDGTKYDAIETVLSGNHLCICDKGKAGSKYTLNSIIEGETEMSIVTKAKAKNEDQPGEIPAVDVQGKMLELLQAIHDKLMAPIESGNEASTNPSGPDHYDETQQKVENDDESDADKDDKKKEKMAENEDQPASYKDDEEEQDKARVTKAGNANKSYSTVVATQLNKSAKQVHTKAANASTQSVDLGSAINSLMGVSNRGDM